MILNSEFSVFLKCGQIHRLKLLRPLISVGFRILHCNSLDVLYSKILKLEFFSVQQLIRTKRRDTMSKEEEEKKKKLSKKKKRQRKPAYEKGYRNEILKILLSCGVYSYGCLPLYGSKKEMLRRKIKQMEEEGLIETINVAHKKVSRFKNFPNTYQDYIESFWLGYYGHYNNYALPNADSIGRYKSKPQSAEKARRESEVVVMMSLADVNVLPEEKIKLTNDDMIPANSSCFYSALEIKDGEPFCFKAKEDENGSIINSRVIGCMISPGGVYAVYHTGRLPLVWAKSVEGQMAYTISSVSRRKYSGTVPPGSIRECIIYGYSNEVFKKICKSTDKPRLLSINNGYAATYVLPYDKDGMILTKILSLHNWKAWIKQKIIPEFNQQTAGLEIEADGIRGNEIAFVFCIPDIMRLCRFAAALSFNAGRITGEKKYVIYCFDFQEDLVRFIVNEQEEIDIKVVNLMKLMED